jgi:xanthine dehydrogenase accessory factor
MIVVDDAANIFGTLGGGCVEAEVRRRAHQALCGRGRIVTFELDADFGHDDGMICGGQMDIALCPITTSTEISAFRVAAETSPGAAAWIPLHVLEGDNLVEYRVCIESQPTLYIAGAGHISRVIADLAVSLQFEVDVIDDRSQYANQRRFPEPVRTHVGNIAKTLKSLPVDGDTYIVIVTRGHKHDEAALRAVIDAPAKYIGMIGSRRKVKVIFDDLRHTGVPDEQLAKVHAPVGLDIGAVTVDEIGLSIAAQLVQVRRAEKTKSVQGPFTVSE